MPVSQPLGTCDHTVKIEPGGRESLALISFAVGSMIRAEDSRPLGIALIVLAMATSARAQYVDTQFSCLACHQTSLQPNLFCELVPAAVWAKSDKHNRAFYLLHETDPADPAKGAEKRALVARILGFELSEAFEGPNFQRLKAAADAETTRKVALVKSCLRCHATWPTAADEKYALAPPAPLALGVSCQGCHGPGERWDLPHRLPAWRTVTPAGKASLGFADVRTTASKAALCVSCHVGNLAEGKFIKHEWYAAGHPPLPSFELATFEAEMPGHWKSLSQKPKFEFRDDRPPDDGSLANQLATLGRAGVPADVIKATYREANFPDAAAKGLDPARDLPRLRSSVIAGAVALEAYTKLVGDYAGRSAAGEAGYAWPELALYDCSACHHRLQKSLGNRQRPEPRGIAGRPPLWRWPELAARLAAQQAAGSGAAKSSERWQAVREPLLELKRATTIVPFGDPAAMQPAAAALAASLQALAHDASQTAFDSSAAQRAIAALTDAANVEINDYATARQAAWLLRQLAADLQRQDSATLFLRGREDPLHLALPSGQQASVIDNLRRWLPAAAAYDAAWFQSELSATKAKLGTP